MRRLGLLLIGSAALAHGPLHEQIDAVTAAIARTPSDAGLFFKRAELQRHHGEWKASAADYEQAARLDPSLAAVDLGRARLALDFGTPREGVAPARRYLKKHPEDAAAHAVLGEALHRSGQPRAAAESYRRAIEAPGGEEVEYFLAEARAWQSAGLLSRAIGALDDGIRRMGPLVALQVPAIEIERKRKAWDRALARVDSVAKQSPRTESWLALRGEILLDAGRREEARAAFAAAFAAIESLPAGLRGVRATSDLEQRVRARIGQ